MIGNYMAMRQATFGAAKLARLVELVDQARDEGRRVVVFSNFLRILETIADAVELAGLITGSVAPATRQRLIDEFASSSATVLAAQIQAGGIGLNIQAGSVVILCEPQWKPTTEDQAIARCHRMGQRQQVQVHRLLALDTCEERMTEILAAKTLLFDRYVRPSNMKDASPHATDTTLTQPDAEALIIEEERQRLSVPSHSAPPDEVPNALDTCGVGRASTSCHATSSSRRTSPTRSVVVRSPLASRPIARLGVESQGRASR
jgi:hypothetical protein